MKYYKFLLGMTSYKRPLDCLRQINCFMKMNYHNMVMSVIVRGVDDITYNHQILPEVQEYIDEKKLFISLQPNSRNYGKNLTDCIDQCPIQDYDYFFKIDDDDFYSKEYLNVVNEHFNKYPNSTGTFINYDDICITGHSKNNKIITIFNSKDKCHGGTMVCNRRLSYIFRDLVNNIDDRNKFMSIYNENNYKFTIKDGWFHGIIEDWLLEDLIMYGLIDGEQFHDISEHKYLYVLYRINPGCIQRTYLD